MRTLFPMLVLSGCFGKDIPTGGDNGEPSEVTTTFFLGQFDMVAHTLDELELDETAPTDIELVELTVLIRDGSSGSTRIFGAVENRSSEVQCRIDVDYELLDGAGQRLWSSGSGIAGSTLTSGTVNLSSCLRPGERGHFFDIDLEPLYDTPATVIVETMGDTGSFVEPANEVLIALVGIEQTGNDSGRVEAEITNLGPGPVDGLRSQVFIHAADATFTDWDLEFDLGSLDAGETTAVSYSAMRIPRDGQAILQVDWD